MTANIQLQVSGDNISTYDIYQDSDNFSTAVLTNVAASTLLSGMELNLNNLSTTVRLRPVGSCNNYDDIIIDFGDQTPSITQISNSTFNTTTSSSGEASQNNFVSNGAGVIFGTYFSPDQNDSFYKVSYDNGDTWTASTLLIENVMCFTVWDGYSFKIVDQHGNGHQFVEQTPGNWILQDYQINNVPYDAKGFYYQNGNYYIITSTFPSTHLYRSTDGINYINVLSSSPQPYYMTSDFIKGYGNTLYFVGNTEMTFWKSTDNGVTWNSVAVNYDPTNFSEYFVGAFYVESENNLLAYIIGPDSNGSAGYWIYSTDGGQTFFNCWIPNGSNIRHKAGIKKVGSVYFITGDSLYYTSSNLFSNTAGPTQSITGTDVSGTDYVNAGNGKFNSYSIFYSSGRIIYVNCSFIAGGAYRTRAYVGLITNT